MSSLGVDLGALAMDLGALGVDLLALKMDLGALAVDFGALEGGSRSSLVDLGDRIWRFRQFLRFWWTDQWHEISYLSKGRH